MKFILNHRVMSLIKAHKKVFQQVLRGRKIDTTYFTRENEKNVTPREQQIDITNFFKRKLKIFRENAGSRCSFEIYE